MGGRKDEFRMRELQQCGEKRSRHDAFLWLSGAGSFYLLLSPSHGFCTPARLSFCLYLLCSSGGLCCANCERASFPFATADLYRLPAKSPYTLAAIGHIFFCFTHFNFFLWLQQPVGKHRCNINHHCPTEMHSKETGRMETCANKHDLYKPSLCNGW